MMGPECRNLFKESHTRSPESRWKKKYSGREEGVHEFIGWSNISRVVKKGNGSTKNWMGSAKVEKRVIWVGEDGRVRFGGTRKRLSVAVPPSGRFVKGKGKLKTQTETVNTKRKGGLHSRSIGFGKRPTLGK